MNNQSISDLLAALAAQSERTQSVFQSAALDTATRNEYLRQVEQYKSMYCSLEQMKSLAGQADTIASLEEKMVSLLTEHLEFEKYCEKQFEKTVS